jgi:hypothetical protein
MLIVLGATRFIHFSGPDESGKNAKHALKNYFRSLEILK